MILEGTKAQLVPFHSRGVASIVRMSLSCLVDPNSDSSYIAYAVLFIDLDDINTNPCMIKKFIPHFCNSNQNHFPRDGPRPYSVWV